MFFDLNVPWEAESIPHLPQHLATLEKLGYHAVAINHRVEGKLPKLPCPITKIDYPSNNNTCSLRQYTRLTLVLSDPQQNYGINAGNDVIRSYDLLAVQPTSEKMFQSACTNLDIDIISLDLSTRLPFSVKAGFLRQALDRGVAFELLYGPLVADAGSRRNIIGNARTLLRLALAKGKGLIISSGATAAWQMRAPADVLNLGGLMGIPSHVRKNCLTSNADSVLIHAGTRKHTFRGAVAIIPDKETLTNDMLEDFVEFK